MMSFSINNHHRHKKSASASASMISIDDRHQNQHQWSAAESIMNISMITSWGRNQLGTRFHWEAGPSDELANEISISNQWSASASMISISINNQWSVSASTISISISISMISISINNQWSVSASTISISNSISNQWSASASMISISINNEHQHDHQLGAQTAWHMLSPRGRAERQTTQWNILAVGDANSLAHALIERQGQRWAIQCVSVWGKMW